jgi:hypothetical protein
MVKHVALVTCLLVTSLGATASAQSLLKPAQYICPATPAPTASGVVRPPAKPLCGQICDTGYTTSTQSTIGGAGSCAAMSSFLTSNIEAAVTSSCMQLTGRRPCSVVVHLTGCLEDGDPDYLIEYGYATYGCNDTSC